MPEFPKQGERVYRGIPVSGGICQGPIFILTKGTGCIPQWPVSEEQIPHELERLEKALLQTRQQILQVQRQVEQAMGANDATIFDAHLLVLEDQTLLDEVERHLHTNRVNVEYA